jgi:uncharacterized protein
MTAKVRTVIDELRSRLQSLYGDRLERLVLFGSQARGDASPESDIDVLVVLHGPVESSKEVHRVSPMTAAISLEHDVVISCVFAPGERYRQGRTPLMLNVLAEGVAL